MEHSAAREKLYHVITVEETFTRLGTRPEGLTSEEAGQRLQKYGPNELREGKKRTVWAMFVDQFKNVMIIILLIAALISGFMNELADTVIILAIVVINAVLGVVQENKAEKALEALKKMSSPKAKVKRNGNLERIDSWDIVPDIVYLEAGDFVPADLRLIEVVNLKADEGLTGESEPVLKRLTRWTMSLVTGDRINMAYPAASLTAGERHRGGNRHVNRSWSYRRYLSETESEKTSPGKA